MSTQTLKALILAGALSVGTELHHSGGVARPERTVTATITRGGIQFDGHTYANPSAAARAVTHGSVNGWTFWRLPDGKPLGTLRGS